MLSVQTQRAIEDVNTGWRRMGDNALRDDDITNPWFWKRKFLSKSTTITHLLLKPLSGTGLQRTLENHSSQLQILQKVTIFITTKMSVQFPCVRFSLTAHRPEDVGRHDRPKRRYISMQEAGLNRPNNALFTNFALVTHFRFKDACNSNSL